MRQFTVKKEYDSILLKQPTLMKMKLVFGKKTLIVSKDIINGINFGQIDERYILYWFESRQRAIQSYMNKNNNLPQRFKMSDFPSDFWTNNRMVG